MLKKKLSLNQWTLNLMMLLLASVTLSSCEIVGDIFEAGVWTGVILIALVIIAIIYIFSRFRRR